MLTHNRNLCTEFCYHCQQKRVLQYLYLEDSGAETIGIFQCSTCTGSVAIIDPSDVFAHLTDAPSLITT